MLQKKNLEQLWILFKSMFLLSACTFGGGFVIVSLMKKKFVEELKWLEEDEMLDITAITQSSPGPLPVNASVIIGYRMQGIPGSLAAVLGHHPSAHVRDLPNLCLLHRIPAESLYCRRPPGHAGRRCGRDPGRHMESGKKRLEQPFRVLYVPHGPLLLRSVFLRCQRHDHHSDLPCHRDHRGGPYAL